MDELNYVEIGKRVKAKRHEAHLTQEKLSEIIDVCPSYISEIERGCSIPSLATITKLANAFNCNLDFLVYGVTASNSNETFTEVVNSIPKKNQKLYIDLCLSIANNLK